jgi:tetratricopeptide (TPR) repeat protein
MDDLNGLDWSSSSNTPKVPVSKGTANYYTTLHPTTSTPPASLSRTSTPLSTQSSGASKPRLSNAIAKSKPGVDSFANLVNFGSAKQANTLSLQEQQQRLQAEKLKKAEEERKQYEKQFGHQEFWDGQAGQSAGRSTISPPPGNMDPFSTLGNIANGSSIGKNDKTNNGENDDLFAAFNKDTKVDNSSYYPPPSTPPELKKSPPPAAARRMDLSDPKAWEKPSASSGFENLGDDDDPFGLGQMGKRTMGNVDPSPIADEDDDFLGDLGKPVEEVRRKVQQSPPPPIQEQESNDSPEADDPWDKAVAELVDMGFTAENSRRALTESGAGLNLQAAVGWLLNDAHKQAKEKAQGRSGFQQPEKSRGSPSDGRQESRERQNESIPAWVRQDRDRSQPRRDDSRSPANSDSDVARAAAAVGSNFLKTANSLWKTSQKKVQRAVADFQQDLDPSQPKWMRDAQLAERQRPAEKETFQEDARDRGRSAKASPNVTSVTDEALMLEADSRPLPRRPKAASERPSQSVSPAVSRDHSPAVSNPSGRPTPVPRWQQQAAPSTALDARSRLSKQALEVESAQAYISPSRRKKLTPTPTPTPQPVEEPNFLFGIANAKPSPLSAPSKPARSSPLSSTQQSSRPVKSSPPIEVRPKAPTRQIPPVSSIALKSSHQYRLAGTAHFKRGDYASAHSSYTSSLSSLPPTHPIVIIILCNRSLTAIKTGDPKAAVSDADTVLDLIGPSRGHNETIKLEGENGEGEKEMKEYYGKALMRKAEALEQMERWEEAGKAWRQAVEAGAGGATAIQGRQRCEKALAPKSKPATPKPIARASPRPKPSASGDLAPAQNTEAVERLRAANAAAEKADDEKFALSDAVDARISAWRDGRKDNLRALLGGMDNVLWEGSGWKKVGLHELVLTPKVKIAYMKAIAKVHPDKVCPPPLHCHYRNESRSMLTEY